MRNRFPLPKRYWFYLFVVLICPILLIGNYYRTNSWTGDKPFSQFTQSDWRLLMIFLAEELIIIGIMLVFLLLVCSIGKKRNAAILAQWEEGRYSGIKPGDYDYIWFDESESERALIMRQADAYLLYVQSYDEYTGNWDSLGSVRSYDNLDAVKRALYYEFDFYCEENAYLE